MFTRYQREIASKRFRAKRRGRKLIATTYRPTSTIDPKVVQAGSHITHWHPTAKIERA